MEKMKQQMAEHTIVQAGNTSSNLYQYNIEHFRLQMYTLYQDITT